MHAFHTATEATSWPDAFMVVGSLAALFGFVAWFIWLASK